MANVTRDIPRPFRYMLNCDQCPLNRSRQNVVIGRGPIEHVRYMFIGEAPGEDEDESGSPFVGQAGQMLSSLLMQAGISEDRIYITNVVKCRPPHNRPPTSLEVKACSSHLRTQVEIIRPKMLVLIGNTALQYYFANLKIMSVHGQVLDSKFGVPTFPIIHPAAALRHREWTGLLLDDLNKLKAARKEAQERLVFAPGPRVMR